MVNLFVELASELRQLVVEYLGRHGLDDVVSFAATCRTFREAVRSWLLCPRVWKARVARVGDQFGVSDRVGGYFHYNEGEW